MDFQGLGDLAGRLAINNATSVTWASVAPCVSIDGQTTSQIAQSLKVHRSSIPLWIEHWNRHREQGLLEGHRAGRPEGLNDVQREQLQDVLDSGPVAYGLGNWHLDFTGH